MIVPSKAREPQDLTAREAGREKSKMRITPFDIPTITESLHNDVASGTMTIEQAAKELCAAGWTNYIDVETTKRLININ